MAGGFDALGLMPELIRAVDEMSWFLPTDVQDESIPLILGGGDVMVAAETGSGKTGAFSLPLVQVVHETMVKEQAAKTPSQGGINLQAEMKIDETDKDGLLVLSPDQLSASIGGSKNWAGARGNYGTKGGRYFYVAVVAGDGICRFGWSTKAGHLELGRDSHGFGYGGTAKKSHGNAFVDYGVKYGDGDVLTCMLDLESMSISYLVNGESQGEAFSLDNKFKGSVFFPAFCIKNCGFSVSFGGSSGAPLRYRGPAGFKPLALANAAHAVSTKSSAAMSTGKRTPRAVVLEPARDLAEQVYNNIVDITKYLVAPSLKTMLIVGGEQKKPNLSGGLDILVGTPLRILDLVKRGELDFSQVRMFVLDEADRLLETGNLSTVLELYAACPAGGVGGSRLQVAFFSATLHSPEIQELGKKLCFYPIWVDLKGKDSVPEFVHHAVYRVLLPDAHIVAAKKKKRSLSGGGGAAACSQEAMEICDDPAAPAMRSVQTFTDNVHPPGQSGSGQSDALKVNVEADSQAVKEAKQKILLEIVDKFQMSQCLIFCRTNLDCDNLEKFLCAAGGDSGKQTFKERKETGKESKYSCCVLAGMRSLDQRRRALEAFKEGDVRFLVCTDVAARGIDIQSLPYVINMTLPDEPENYIHRIGRVGRAGRMGLAISIVAGGDTKEKVWYHTCGNRGQGCTNRKLKEHGGCTIWYDEPEMLRCIEKRLDMQIPELGPDFSLPESLSASGAVYGEGAAQEQADPLIKQHVEMLIPVVKDLVEMETTCQNMFLNYTDIFGHHTFSHRKTDI